MSMSTIIDLENKVFRLRDELRTAEVALKNAKIEACPIQVGDVYVHPRRGRAVVTSIVIGPWSNSACGQLALYKKDGTLGLRTAFTADWGWVKDRKVQQFIRERSCASWIDGDES